MKKTAFTLMEILISLTIIGVVVVLTIPNFVGDTTSKISSVTLKSTYSQVGDAFKQAMIDQGVRHIIDLDFQGDDNKEKISNFLRKYMDASKDCTSTYTPCFAGTYKNLSGLEISNPFQCNGKSFSESMKLSNGAAIALYIDFEEDDTSNMYLLIDINGADKPNVFGKDTFAAKISPNGDLGSNVKSSDYSSVSADCKKNDDASVAIACFDLLRAKNWDLDNYLN